MEITGGKATKRIRRARRKNNARSRYTCFSPSLTFVGKTRQYLHSVRALHHNDDDVRETVNSICPNSRQQSKHTPPPAAAVVVASPSPFHHDDGPSTEVFSSWWCLEFSRTTTLGSFISNCTSPGISLSIASFAQHASDEGNFPLFLLFELGKGELE